MADPLRGEVWLADLGATRGHEQAGRRPVLVLSVDAFNAGPADLVIVLPITATIRPIPAHVAVNPPEGGLRVPSAILCDAIRSVTKSCLVAPWGSVTPATLADVELAVRALLGL
jgi:mRNA interferase MazF